MYQQLTDGMVTQTIEDLVANKASIAAVRFYRAITGASLHDAVMAVRWIECGNSLPLPRPISTAPTSAERAGYVLAMRLLQSGLLLDEEERAAIRRFTP